jgi:hypothetical protein
VDTPDKRFRRGFDPGGNYAESNKLSFSRSIVSPDKRKKPPGREPKSLRKKPREAQYTKNDEREYVSLLSEFLRTHDAEPAELVKLTFKHMLIFKSALGLSQNMTLKLNMLLKNRSQRNSVVEPGLKKVSYRF